MRGFIPAILFCLVPLISFSQLSNLRVKNISVKADTIALDTVSVVPSSIILMSNGHVVDTTAYHVDYVKSVFIWNKSSTQYQTLVTQTINLKRQTSNHHDSLTIYFRVFPF